VYRLQKVTTSLRHRKDSYNKTQSELTDERQEAQLSL